MIEGPVWVGGVIGRLTPMNMSYAWVQTVSQPEKGEVRVVMWTWVIRIDVASAGGCSAMVREVAARMRIPRSCVLVEAQIIFVVRELRIMLMARKRR
jgi:hypothetical protein